VRTSALIAICILAGLGVCLLTALLGALIHAIG